MLSSSVRKSCKVLVLAICCAVFCLSVAFADTPLVANNNVDGLTHAQYIGGGYIRGVVTGLGDVEIYFPYSSRHSWGLTADSYLCNINSSSVTGIMFDSSGRQYDVSCYGFLFPVIAFLILRVMDILICIVPFILQIWMFRLLSSRLSILIIHGLILQLACWG